MFNKSKIDNYQIENFSMENQTVALLLAIVALSLGVVVVVRERRRETKSGFPVLVLVVGPLAGIINVLPGVLRLSETVQIVASRTSIILSLGVIGVLAVRMIRNLR